MAKFIELNVLFDDNINDQEAMMINLDQVISISKIDIGEAKNLAVLFFDSSHSSIVSKSYSEMKSLLRDKQQFLD